MTRGDVLAVLLAELRAFLPGRRVVVVIDGPGVADSDTPSQSPTPAPSLSPSSGTGERRACASARQHASLARELISLASLTASSERPLAVVSVGEFRRRATDSLPQQNLQHEAAPATSITTPTPTPSLTSEPTPTPSSPTPTSMPTAAPTPNPPLPSNPSDLDLDFEHLTRCVLTPFRQGEEAANISAAAPALPLRPDCVLLIEGAGLLRPELLAWWDASVWVRAPAGARAAGRGGVQHEGAEEGREEEVAGGDAKSNTRPCRGECKLWRHATWILDDAVLYSPRLSRRGGAVPTLSRRGTDTLVPTLANTEVDPPLSRGPEAIDAALSHRAETLVRGGREQAPLECGEYVALAR